MYSNYSTKNSESNHKGTRRRLRLLMIAVLCFMGWAGVTFWDQAGKVNAKFAQLSLLESKLEETKKLNKEYKLEIKRLNDDEYIEQWVRKYYQMTRPGETLYIMPKADESSDDGG